MNIDRFAFLLITVFVGFVPSSETHEKEDIILTLSTGKIRGRTHITSKNRTGVVFLGVPFAEAPVGSLR